MRTQKVTFDNDTGQSLHGLIDLPTGPPRAFALLAHCFTCTKNLKAAKNISAALGDAGIATLRFDFTGLGQSEGEFAATTFSSNVADLIAAAGFLARDYQAPALLIGHSLGGTAVLQAAARIDSAVGVATIAAPARPSHVLKLIEGDRAAIERDGEAEVQLAGRPFRIRRQFIDDLEKHALPESVRSLRKALLVFHSPNDELVDIGNASELFQNALHPKSFISLGDADHLLSRSEDSTYVGTVLAGWAQKYLGADEPAGVSKARPGGTTATTATDGFLTTIDSNGHRLIADEPASVPGGTDQGPSPYELLAAALASCTTMTLGMYARHKKLDATSFSARVTHERIHAEDCEHCEKETGHIDRFNRELSFEGELTDAQRVRIVEIADRCPVHKTLHNEVDVQTVLQTADAGQ